MRQRILHRLDAPVIVLVDEVARGRAVPDLGPRILGQHGNERLEYESARHPQVSASIFERFPDVRGGDAMENETALWAISARISGIAPRLRTILRRW